MERSEHTWGTKEMKLALRSGGVDVPEDLVDKEELRKLVHQLAEAAQAKWAEMAAAEVAAAKAAAARPLWRQAFRTRSLAALAARASATTSVDGGTDRIGEESDDEDSTELRDSIRLLSSEGPSTERGEDEFAAKVEDVLTARSEGKDEEGVSSERSTRATAVQPLSYRKNFRAKGTAHSAAAQATVARSTAIAPEEHLPLSPRKRAKPRMLQRDLTTEAAHQPGAPQRSQAVDELPELIAKARHSFDDFVNQWFRPENPDRIRQIT